MKDIIVYHVRQFISVILQVGRISTCLCVFGLISLQAQDGINPQIDSIQTLILASTDKDQKVEHYNSLLELTLKVDISEGLKYANELLSFSEKNDSDKGMAIAYKGLAFHSLFTGDNNEAIRLYEISIDYFKKAGLLKETLQCMNNMSLCYARIGNIEKAAEFAQKSLDLALELDVDKELLIPRYKRMGEIHGYLYNDIGKGMEYLDKALSIAEEIEDESLIISVLQSQGTTLNLSDQPKAKIALLRAEALATKDPIYSNDLGHIRSILFDIYYGEGNYSKATELGTKNLAQAEKKNNMFLIVKSLVSLGDLHKSIGNQEKSKDYYYQAISASKKSNIYQGYIAAYFGLGILNNDKPEKSIEYHNKALSKADSIGAVHMSLQILPELASKYLDVGAYDKAKVCLDKTVAINGDKNPAIQQVVDFAYGQYYLHKRNFSKAEAYLSKVNSESEKINDHFQNRVSAKLLSEVKAEKGDYKSALYWKNKEVALTDSLNLVENQEKITRLEVTSKFEKEKEVLALKQEQEQTLLKEKQTRTSILGIGAFLGFLFLSIFYFLLRKKNKTLAELNNVKDTLFQIIGHDLKKPSINFRNISKNINYLLDKKDYNRLQALGNEVDQDAKSLYNLTDNLLNWALVQKEGITIKKEKVNVYQLVQYNIELFQSIATRKNITLINSIDVDVNTEIDRNSFDTIIRNLLDNGIKYTNDDGEIVVTSKEVNKMVQVTVVDNGVGMDNELVQLLTRDEIVQSNKGTEGEKGSGIGLQLVKQLIRKNSGSLSIDSTMGSGSRFTLSLPLAR